METCGLSQSFWFVEMKVQYKCMFVCLFFSILSLCLLEFMQKNTLEYLDVNCWP